MLAMYHIVNPKAQFCLIAQYKKRQGKMETIILYNLALTLKTWVNVIQHYLHCMDFGLLVCHFRVQWTLQEETVTMFEETCGGIKSDLWFEFATFVFVNTECCQKQHLSTKVLLFNSALGLSQWQPQDITIIFGNFFNTTFPSSSK